MIPFLQITKNFRYCLQSTLQHNLHSTDDSPQSGKPTLNLSAFNQQQRHTEATLVTKLNNEHQHTAAASTLIIHNNNNRQTCLKRIPHQTYRSNNNSSECLQLWNIQYLLTLRWDMHIELEYTFVPILNFLQKIHI